MSDLRAALERAATLIANNPHATLQYREGWLDALSAVATFLTAKVEREARQQGATDERERIRAAVEALPRYEAISPLVYIEYPADSGKGSALERAKVLAILDAKGAGEAIDKS